MMHTRATFEDYTRAFIQRVPKYGIKTKKHGWVTRNKPLADPAIKAHLDKKYTVGGLSPWYPQYAILDLDDKSMRFVDEIRDTLRLDEANSMLLASESANSYHCLLRPTLNGKPPTRHQLTKSFKTFATTKGIEVYPQVNRVVRLPFGQFSKCLDLDRLGLKTWQEKLFWFNKLDDFSLSEVQGQQYEIAFTKPLDDALPALVGPGGGGWYAQGAELLKTGLQGPSTRHESQAKVIYYLFRNNVPFDEAMRQTWAWIKQHHNEFSKDILKYAPAVKKEIQRQVTHVYSNYHWAEKYPDNTHNQHNGYIAKPDVGEILKITGGSIPRSRFLFHLVKHSYPRRHRTFVPVHSNLLRTWARQDGKYLNELEGKGIVKRGKSYLTSKLAKEISKKKGVEVKAFAKSLSLTWDYKNSEDSVLFEGRSIDTFEDTIKLLFEPSDFRAMLRGATNNKAYIRRIVRGIYEPSQGGGQSANI